MMSVLVLISRITGFLRTWAQAFAMGATVLASCYSIANTLPDQLYELVVFWALLTVMMQVTEEKWLLEQFGDEYREYCKRVNRCIPWFPKR